MNKGLEALEDINQICDRIDFHRKHFLGNVDENWIEKRIKQKSSIIEKELKALEIIKEKKVNPYIDVCCYNNYNHYLEEYEYFNNKLTKEEYDLLKEVLL